MGIVAGTVRVTLTSTMLAIDGMVATAVTVARMMVPSDGDIPTMTTMTYMMVVQSVGDDGGDGLEMAIMRKMAMRWQ